MRREAARVVTPAPAADSSVTTLVARVGSGGILESFQPSPTAHTAGVGDPGLAQAQGTWIPLATVPSPSTTTHGAHDKKKLVQCDLDGFVQRSAMDESVKKIN
jgi:hypothetical protein